MAETISEKIFGLKSESKVKAGDIVRAKVDFALSQDGTSSLVIDSFNALGTKNLNDPAKYALVIDHSVPSPNMGVSNIHKKMKDFAASTAAIIYGEGEGVCHQIIMEQGHALPSNLIAGADSHTCTYGALNCFSTGMGSTDIAIIIATGKNWFKVPSSVKVVLKGRLPEGVFSKDVILHIIGALGASSCTYKAIEFAGEALSEMSMAARFTITNMAVELGAKAGLMDFDDKTAEWLKDKTDNDDLRSSSVSADTGAKYEWVKEFDLSNLSPQIAKPHQVDNVVDIGEIVGNKIDQGFIGTCTNGRLEDLEIAAGILKGKKVKARLIVAPISKRVLAQAQERGLIEALLSSGALILPPGCGPCVGTHGGVPADKESVISTANRNFKGRMGNPGSFIYLGSPATVAASVLEGKITDPRRYLNR
jgi:3-isopropylmalate/(R)-2-methylmalate dehydratase large subunit